MEAEQREKLATKLFNRAKEFAIRAKGVQRADLYIKYGNTDGPPAVSQEAMELLRKEAARIGSLLRTDASKLRVLEKVYPQASST